LDKDFILKSIIQELEREFTTLQKAAHDARDAATHEEAKAESKYDTHGLEASYLAGAQAKRAKEVQDLLRVLRGIRIRDYHKDTPIDPMALVETEVNGREKKLFFIVPQQGGMKIKIEDLEVFTLSPDSPLGQNIVGKRVGHLFEFKVGKEIKEYEIVAVS